MTYLLLLVNADGTATTSPLVIRELREFPGDEGLSVHFRPIRNDLLFESAKVAGRLAYRILAGEGIVRSQLWVEYEVRGPHVNVMGRSSDLLFALALITAKWKKANGRFPAIAATGVLDADGAALSVAASAAVHSVEHASAKVAAAVSALANEPDAVIFYPIADAKNIATWSERANVPAHIRLQPVACLEDALAFLGIKLEKVYLGNPYRGLEYFDYAHRSIFFGRDREITEVLRQLLRREAAGSPGVLVEGASGAGKSSFLRAGVLAALVNPASQPIEVEEALRRRPVHDTVSRTIWRIGLLHSNADEQQLQQSIRECWRCLPELVGVLDGDGKTLDNLADELRAAWPTNQRFVWLLDQFEELFSLGLNTTVIASFGRFLIRMQTDGVWTLASIRADSVPQLRLHSTLRQVFGTNEGHYYLETIDAIALDEVILRPASAANLTFGMGQSGKRLDQQLRADAYRDHENALPLLQFTLYELYQRRSGTELPFTAYEQLGGISGSVATAADAVLLAETADGHRVMPRLFRSLVNVDELGRPARRYSPTAELADEPIKRRVLARLVEARLCVTDQHDGRAVVTIAHEALLRTWPALVDWLHQEAELLQTREVAQRETRQWQLHGESENWLATADKLATFKSLAAAEIDLTEPVRNFIRRSEKRVRRTIRIKQLAVSIIAILAVVASGAGWIASQKQHEAESQAAQTLESQARLLTEAAAQHLKDADSAGAQGIILEVLTNPAFASVHTPAAINAFQEIRAADAQRVVLAGHRNIVNSAVYSPDGTHILTASDDKTARVWDAFMGTQIAMLSGHDGPVTFAAYSPDGTRIVTASLDKAARIWDAQSDKQIAVLSGHGGPVASATFSPDGTRIVTASWDKTARVWDAHSGMQIVTLSGHSHAVLSAAYSPNGTHVVTASDDNTARIWDAHSGKQLAVLHGHDAGVVSVAYSPDGTHIVTASHDKTARVWDAHSGKQLAVLSGHRAWVESATFSPDGSRIVTASYDRTTRIWDARTHVQLATLSGHADRVASAVYSPDGARIVTASLDKTARIWNAHLDAQLAILRSNGNIGTARYSPDGTRIVTASNDRTARIWDARTAKLLVAMSRQIAGDFTAADYSPDGTRIVTAGIDARIWDARTGTQLAVLSGHGAGVLSGAFSPDGTRIVTASDDKTARIWDTQTGEQLTVLSGHDGSVHWAVYSPDNSRIVTGSWDKTARIWDAQTGKQLAVLSQHTGSVSSVAYSPDGTHIATASYDNTARVWDALTGAQLTVLSGHDGVVESVAYSPDGTLIVTASLDKTARIWDARTGAQLVLLAGHENLVETAAYSPDGKRIVTASDDNTARIWDARVPADIAAQILWYKAAETDSLSDVDRTQLGLPPNMIARTWYQQAADKNLPNALARLAERDETNAVAATETTKKNKLLLQAFARYAAAVAHASREEWPVETWRAWRYRRATLARLLAENGMMQQVANAYKAVLDGATPGEDGVY